MFYIVVELSSVQLQKMRRCRTNHLLSRDQLRCVSRDFTVQQSMPDYFSTSCRLCLQTMIPHLYVIGSSVGCVVLFQVTSVN